MIGKQLCTAIRQVMKLSKQLVNGKEFFDGEPVELYEGRFSGGFAMDPATAAPLATDDEVTFIVRVSVDTPKFTKVKKTNEIKRTNSMKVQEAFAIDPSEAKYLLDNMGEVPVVEEPLEQEQVEDWTYQYG